MLQYHHKPILRGADPLNDLEWDRFPPSNTFRYRIPFTINNSSGSTLTNYQVMFIIYRTNGTSSGTKVYLGDSVKSDFSNIWFFSPALENQPYWIESYNSSFATVWVKFNSIPTGDSTWYLCYGNFSATSAQSAPGDIFIKYEGFESGTVGVFTNSGGQTATVQTSTVKEGTYALKLTDTSSSGNGARYSPANTFWDQWQRKIEVWMRSETTSTGTGTISTYLTKNGYERCTCNIIDDGRFSYWNGSTTYFGTSKKNTWYKFQFRLGSSNWGFSVFDTNYKELYRYDNLSYGSSSITYTDVCLFSSNGAVGDSYFDGVRTCQYAIPEPTVSAWGNIQRL